MYETLSIVVSALNDTGNIYPIAITTTGADIVSENASKDYTWVAVGVK